jgi:predicted deacylase
MEDLGAVTRELDVESIPTSTTLRLRLHLIEDGAGFSVCLPVMVARGKRPGPVLGVIAAVHGDEINGIPVIHHLFERLEPGRLAGTVIAVLVTNYPSFDRHQRRYIDGIDLNHIMPGKETGNASQTYGHRLLERVVSKFDYMVDLHTASRGRINSLYARADLRQQASAEMADLLRPQIILHSTPRDGTIRGEANELDIPSVTLEIGNPQRFQPELIRSSVRGLRSVMAHLGMLKVRPRAEGKEPIVCERSYWMYTDRGGLLSVHPGLCERLEGGQPLATLTNVFGDVTRRYEMPEDGVVIGKAVNPVGYTGARIAHIGIEKRR